MDGPRQSPKNNWLNIELKPEVNFPAPEVGTINFRELKSYIILLAKCRLNS